MNNERQREIEKQAAEAYYDGKSLYANPYVIGSEEHTIWETEWTVIHDFELSQAPDDI